jgi:3-dehydroquinate dehydratase/shikimate dehydrogenase
MDRPIRCLPLLPGDLNRFPKMLEKMKINGLIVDPCCNLDLTPLAASTDEGAASSGRIDVLMGTPNGWKGVCTTFAAIEEAGRQTLGAADWTGRGAVAVLGSSAMARGAAQFFAAKGAAVSLAGMSDNAAATQARQAGVRHVPWNAVYDLRCDTLVIADYGIPCGLTKGCLNPSIIRERQIVVDLSTGLRGAEFAEEAQARGARYIDPVTVFAARLDLQFRQLTGRGLPPDAFQQGLSGG